MAILKIRPFQWSDFGRLSLYYQAHLIFPKLSIQLSRNLNIKLRQSVALRGWYNTI